MTNNPSDSKKKNTNATAQSTSDPSGSQPVSSSPRTDPHAGKTANTNSSSAPLQPDPQFTDNGKADHTPMQPSGTTASPGTPPPSTSAPPADNSFVQQPPGTRRPPSSQPRSGGFDEWGFDDPFGDLDGGTGGTFGGGYGRSPSYGGGSTGRAPAKRLTPEERVQMIERVYNEILQRKPDTRDINYYKYSTLSEDQIRKQLIASAEHSDMLKKGREYQNIKEQAEQLESRVRMLEGQLKDHVEEFRELSNLLQEKNRLIQELRAGNAHRMPQPREGPIRAEDAAQPLPPEDNRSIQPQPVQQENTGQKEQPSLKEPSPLTPSAASPEQSPSQQQTTEQPAQQSPQDMTSLPQTKPPVNLPVFTQEHGAPPPPDIETENGIITAEQNSPGRRIKRTLRDMFSSVF